MYNDFYNDLQVVHFVSVNVVLFILQPNNFLKFYLNTFFNTLFTILGTQFLVQCLYFLSGC